MTRTPGRSIRPAACERCCARVGGAAGCTGNRSARSRNAATSRAAASGVSTFAGRWTVATAYLPARPRRAVTGPGSNRSRCASSVSIIGLPTKCIRSRSTPSSGEIVEALRAGHEQQVGERVGDAPVDLLGHRHVEAAQPASTCASGIRAWRIPMPRRASSSRRHRRRRGQGRWQGTRPRARSGVPRSAGRGCRSQRRG